MRQASQSFLEQPEIEHKNQNAGVGSEVLGFPDKEASKKL
jgi:hypothetical protein